MTRPLTLMTGATSGFGRICADTLIAAGDEVIATTRSGTVPDGAEALTLDLSRLSDVRRAVDDLAARGIRPVDRLILNAGGNFRMDKTDDGFEANFAVNHLAHYLLLRGVTPMLSPSATVIITSSGTHDPAEKTAIPAPLHADARRLAHPETDPELDPDTGKATGRAYSAAKLANLMTARHFAALPEAAAMTVIAYSPGPVPGTGLVSGRGGMLGLVWKNLGPLLRLAIPGTHSPDLAGRTLADLALGRTSPPDGRVYALLKSGELTFPDPSDLAREDDATRKMWEDSAELAGWTA